MIYHRDQTPRPAHSAILVLFTVCCLDIWNLNTVESEIHENNLYKLNSFIYHCYTKKRLFINLNLHFINDCLLTTEPFCVCKLKI